LPDNYKNRNVSAAQNPAHAVWGRAIIKKPKFPNHLTENIMQMTTTPSIEGKRITRYCGVIAGEAILGANIFKDLFAGIRDLVGGRSGTYEKELQRARDIAMAELEQRAKEIGANAIVGIDLDYEVLGEKNGMLMVSASGTAVVVE
jgi:uncharacterized protein YbjQ (UPF0145 family)